MLLNLSILKDSRESVEWIMLGLFLLLLSFPGAPYSKILIVKGNWGSNDLTAE